VQGIARPYANRFSDVLDFFKQEGHPGEMVLSFDPEFPLRFYTQLTVIDGRLTVPPNGRLPEWILASSASGLTMRKPVALPDFLKPYYETITIPVRDSFWADSIPEPDNYQYQSARRRVPFTIYRLKTGTKKN
jgi:hypothetical protein